jgi:hypothetical protein
LLTQFPFLPLTHTHTHSLSANPLEKEGVRCLARFGRTELEINVTAHKALFTRERNTAVVGRSYGQAPLQRFRVYVCGYSGKHAHVCVACALLVLSPACMLSLVCFILQKPERAL